jgi:hypothetical protein
MECGCENECGMGEGEGEREGQLEVVVRSSEACCWLVSEGGWMKTAVEAKG